MRLLVIASIAAVSDAAGQQLAASGLFGPLTARFVFGERDFAILPMVMVQRSPAAAARAFVAGGGLARYVDAFERERDPAAVEMLGFPVATLAARV